MKMKIKYMLIKLFVPEEDNKPKKLWGFIKKQSKI
jgi:hypothetical protein